MNVLVMGAGEAIDSQLPFEDQFKASGDNFGNLLIGGGLRAYLRRHSCIRNFSSFGSVAECAEWTDLLAIGAANWLWSGFDFGWLGEIIRELNKPVAMVGLGSQNAERITFDRPSVGTISMLMEVAARSKSIGVRGFHSAEILASLGIVNVAVLGCPSLYVSSADSDSTNLAYSRHQPSKAKLCVGFSRRVSSHSFRQDMLRDFERALLQYALDEDSLVVLQDEKDEMSSIVMGDADTAAAHSYFGIQKNSAASDFLTRNSRWFLSADQWTQNAVNNKAYIGSRLHGTISFLREGKPAFLIAHDSRTLEVARTFAIPHVCVLDLPLGEGACGQYLRDEFAGSFSSRIPWSMPRLYVRSYEQFWRDYGLLI